jgi:hypothetical protein
MVRNDGNYVIYLIQHKERSGRWVRSIENERYFKASDECWQITGIHGTFDLEHAKKVYEHIINIEEEGNIYRIVKVTINQKTEDVDLISVSNDNENLKEKIKDSIYKHLSHVQYEERGSYGVTEAISDGLDEAFNEQS